MFCKNCGSEIDDKVVLCPKCGVAVEEKKKSIFKKWWFWVIVAVAVIAIASGSSDSEEQPVIENNNSATVNMADTSAATQPAQKEEIAYEKVDLQTMLDELEANALKAEKTYQNKFVEVVGKISNFDSDGTYISIEPENADPFNFTSVMCYIKNDAQLNFLLEKEVGDTVTVKGKITSIGEVLGYSIKMDEVQ